MPCECLLGEKRRVSVCWVKSAVCMLGDFLDVIKLRIH